MKVASKKPGKQRKALYTHKNHQRSRLNSVKVADFLQEEYGVKKLPLRVGDQVKVCKGEFKDFEGEILEITKNHRAKIKECAFERADGTQFYPGIYVSNLVITRFYKEKKMDAYRAKMIERKSGYKIDEEIVAPKKQKKPQDKVE
ncbi:MAG: 50S ribosomal protein L24 [Promethearchaeota archaeon]